MNCLTRGDEVAPKVRALVRSLRAWAKANPVQERAKEPERRRELAVPEDDAEAEAEQAFERYMFPEGWFEPDL